MDKGLWHVAPLYLGLLLNYIVKVSWILANSTSSYDTWNNNFKI